MYEDIIIFLIRAVLIIPGLLCFGALLHLMAVANRFSKVGRLAFSKDDFRYVRRLSMLGRKAVIGYILAKTLLAIFITYFAYGMLYILIVVDFSLD